MNGSSSRMKNKVGAQKGAFIKIKQENIYLSKVISIVLCSYYRTIIYATSRDVQQKCLVPYFCHFLPEMSQFDRVLKKRMELKWVYLHCHFLLQWTGKSAGNNVITHFYGTCMWSSWYQCKKETNSTADNIFCCLVHPYNPVFLFTPYRWLLLTIISLLWPLTVPDSDAWTAVLFAYPA